MFAKPRRACNSVDCGGAGAEGNNGGAGAGRSAGLASDSKADGLSNNWLCSLRPYTSREHRVVLWALDVGVCAALEPVLRTFAEGAATCIEGGDARPVDDAQREQNKMVKYQGKNYLRNTNKKLPIFVAELERAARGTWYLFCDIDLVFIKCPFDFLKRVPKKSNFLFQQSPKWCPQKPTEAVVRVPDDPKVLRAGSEPVCTGLFFVRAGAESVALLRKGITLLPTSFDGADQGAINAALAASKTGIQLLQCHDFPNGSNFFGETEETRTPIAVHFNYFYKSKKKAMCMRETGMWVHDASKVGAGVCGKVQLPLKRRCSCWEYNKCR